jgi:5-methylcytosine-specific restriction enzyme A
VITPAPVRLVLALAAGYGDVRAWAEGRRRSPRWPKLRRAWLADNPRCAACGGSKAVEVHHCVPFSWRPDWELERSNFLTLCEQSPWDCHLRIGHCGNWTKANPHARADAAASLASVQGVRTRDSYRGERW